MIPLATPAGPAASSPTARHRLLLLAVCLPCVGLVLLGARLIERENALAAARTLDAHNRTAEEISRAIVDQLEGVVSAELAEPPADRYVEDATAFIAPVRDMHLLMPAAGVARLDPALAAAYRRLANDSITLPRIRGALGEPRVVAYDDGRLLLALRYTDGHDPQLIAIHAAQLIAAAGVELGDSLMVLATPREHAIALGDGIDGLWLAWTGDGAPATPWRGPQLYYLASLIVIGALGALGVYLVARDAEREWRLARLRQNFVAAVSHELKTPLTSIRVFAETLRDRPLKPGARDEYLSTMIEETERLSRLVDNVLEFTRIERGDRTYRLIVGDVSDVVRRAVAAMRYALEQQGFRIRVDCPECVPAVRLDADAVEQAVLNLLTNAMKYSGESRDIVVEVAPSQHEVRVAVRDLGIGIAESERDRIFERFYRSPSIGPEIAGTGLGLTLVQHVVSAHGGRVVVDSAAGRGSTFNIFLPLAGAA